MAMETVTHTRQPNVTRARLLDAAFAEIHRNGYQAASLANILSASGLTKGALYHHFADKQTLGLAVLDEVIGAYIMHTFVDPLTNTPKPVATLIQILYEIGSGSCVAKISLGCPFSNMMQEMSGIDPAFRVRLAHWLGVWQNAFISALQRARDIGEIRPDVDCEAAALFIIASMEGCMSLAKNHQSVTILHQCGGQLITYINMLKA